jgi:predicted component of type VI protein secretion system
MLRLQQIFGAHAGRTCEFDQDVIRFGRLPTNDFAFDPHADLDASGSHAEIRKENGRYVLVDVGSRNGTLVNGRPVQRFMLEGGEEIEFGTGGPRVRVEIASAVMAPGGPPPEPSAIPTPIWPAPAIPPSRLPSPMMSTPAPLGLQATPLPPLNGSMQGGPKLYGQKTVDLMIQSAVSAADPNRVPPSANPPHDNAHIRKVADENLGPRSKPMVIAIGIALAIFGVALCVVSAVLAVLWLRAYGRI